MILALLTNKWQSFNMSWKAYPHFIFSFLFLSLFPSLFPHASMVTSFKSFRLRILNSNLPSDSFNQESVIQNMSNASPFSDSCVLKAKQLKLCYKCLGKSQACSKNKLQTFSPTMLLFGNLWIPSGVSWGLCILKRRQEQFWTYKKRNFMQLGKFYIKQS